MTSQSITGRSVAHCSIIFIFIKKNITPQNLQPSDIVIERFVTWKAIIKQPIAYFEVRHFSDFVYIVDIIRGVADIEHNTAKEMTRLGVVIHVPFRSGNQFLGEGELQVRSLPMP